jgi:hypothetical protein
MLSGVAKSGFFPMAHKVVQPENIRHAEIDPLQPYTSVAARLVLRTYPYDLSLGKNRAMILWQIDRDVYPITHPPTFTGADKNSNRAYVFGFSLSGTTFA